MMRALLLLPLLALVPVTHEEGHVSLASMDVMLPPDAVRQRLLDVDHWSGRFSDVTAAHVVSTQDGVTQVEFTSKLFRHTLGAVLSSDSNHMVLTVNRGPSALGIQQQWTWTPLPEGRGTHVEVRLKASVDGWMGLLFPELRVRALRAEKLQTDLADLVK